MVLVINLGSSNLQSVLNALDYLKSDYCVSDKKEDFERCERFILPGVGTFGNAMARLKELDLIDSLLKEIDEKKKPILGICLGMQLLFDTSEESPGVRGLGIIRGEVKMLRKNESEKVPRIGWGSSKLKFDFLGLQQESEHDFYYIHSYHVKPINESVVAITTDDKITAAVKQENVYGCQFHPEKSFKSGLEIIKFFNDLKV